MQTGHSPPRILVTWLDQMAEYCASKTCCFLKTSQGTQGNGSLYTVKHSKAFLINFKPPWHSAATFCVQRQIPMTHGTAGVNTGMHPVRSRILKALPRSSLDEKYRATWNALSCGRCGWLPFQSLVWHAGWLTWLSQNPAPNSIYPQLACYQSGTASWPCTMCTK